MYKTYKFYDKQGRRLSVFCRALNNQQAEIVSFACSKHDRFKKKFAVDEYIKYINGKETIVKPIINIITIEGGKNECLAMLDYCNKNYYYSIKQYVLIPKYIVKKIKYA